MPLYTYACATHGEFAAWGKLETSGEPQACPSCEQPAPRAMAHPAVGNRSSESDIGCGAAECGQGMCAGPAPVHHCGAGCLH